MSIYFLGNCTVNFLAKAFRKASGIEVDVSDFSQYQQDILFKESKFYSYTVSAGILYLDGDTLLEIGNGEEICAHIEGLVNAFNQNRSKQNLIISNVYLRPITNSIQSYNTAQNLKLDQLKINQFLNDVASTNENVYVLDVLSIIEEQGTTTLFDDGLWTISKSRLTKPALQRFSSSILQLLNAINSVSKKCLVLDLDNTLWGGVVGEDGLEGIQLCKDGIGETFLKFQKAICAIKDKGVLLALCSKNNLEDAKAVFDKHPFSQLTWDDFVATQVNWESKDQNIKIIATTLNIGEDSLVFIDDNPAERAIVEANTDCVVADFPERNEDLLTLIHDVDRAWFGKLRVNTEDKNKTANYKQNFQRQASSQTFSDPIDFINSLEIKLNICVDNPDHIQRIAQLTQKTNQFNFTTHRYSENDIRDFMESDSHEVFSGEIVDKFGEQGITVLAIVKKEQSGYLFDTFLMSCRVIGKHIEDVFLQEIANKLGRDNSIEIHYLPTKKNQLLVKRIEEMGLEQTLLNADGSGVYTYPATLELPEKIRIRVEYD